MNKPLKWAKPGIRVFEITAKRTISQVSHYDIHDQHTISSLKILTKSGEYMVTKMLLHIDLGK